MRENIILPPVPPRPPHQLRPTLTPVPEKPGNKGVKVLMVKGPGHPELPEPPEPPTPPVIGNITSKVEGSPYDFDNGGVIDALNGEDFLMQVITDGDPGVSYTWNVRQGQARLSPSGSTCIATMQSEPPQGVQVQCDLINNNASDSPKSTRFAFFVGGSG